MSLLLHHLEYSATVSSVAYCDGQREQQWDAAIMKAFPNGKNPDFRNDKEDGQSVWNLGPPSTIQSMVQATDRSSLQGTEASLSQQAITKKRLQKLGEEITGGKM